MPTWGMLFGIQLQELCLYKGCANVRDWVVWNTNDLLMVGIQISGYKGFANIRDPDFWDTKDLLIFGIRIWHTKDLLMFGIRISGIQRIC